MRHEEVRMDKRVLAFGEVLLRLSPPGRLRLEQAGYFEVYLGGAELNVAAALSRLGTGSSILTALPENPLGRLAAAGVRRAGVGDELIVWRKRGRMGLYFVEFGCDPRPTRVMYDRSGSAASGLRPGDIEWEEIMRDFDHLHTTGITAALSRGCLRLVEEALASARRLGLSSSFDVNHRSLLWNEARARKALLPLATLVDHLVVSLHDARNIFQIKDDDPEVLARALSERYGCASVAITMREQLTVTRARWEAVAWDGRRLHRDRPYEVEAVDRIGSGDAFAAGYIHGILCGDPGLGLRLGNAMAALKHSVFGDVLYCDTAEVMELAEGSEGSPRIRR